MLCCVCVCVRVCVCVCVCVCARARVCTDTTSKTASLVFPPLLSPLPSPPLPTTNLASPPSSLIHMDGVELAPVNGTRVDVLKGESGQEVSSLCMKRGCGVTLLHAHTQGRVSIQQRPGIECTVCKRTCTVCRHTCYNIQCVKV